MDEYFSMGKDEAPDNIPMTYFTFPSAKDPTSKIRHPGITPGFSGMLFFFFLFNMPDTAKRTVTDVKVSSATRSTNFKFRPLILYMQQNLRLFFTIKTNLVFFCFFVFF